MLAFARSRQGAADERQFTWWPRPASCGARWRTDRNRSIPTDAWNVDIDRAQLERRCQSLPQCARRHAHGWPRPDRDPNVRSTLPGSALRAMPGAFVQSPSAIPATASRPTRLDLRAFLHDQGQRQGSGLGSAWFYGFIKQSHGHITVTSEMIAARPSGCAAALRRSTRARRHGRPWRGRARPGGRGQPL